MKEYIANIDKLVLSTLLAVGAIGVAVAGAAAQDESTTDPIAIASGTVAGQPFDVSLAVWDDETGQMSGLALSIPVETTDSRLTGTLSMVSTGAGERHGEGGTVIQRSTYRLSNGDGTWVGQGWEAEARPAPDEAALFHTGVMMLEGGGAYEGLAAFVSVTDDGEVPMLEAVIIENTLPPAPEPVSPPAW